MFFQYFYVKSSDNELDKSIKNIIVKNLISFLFIPFNLPKKAHFSTMRQNVKISGMTCQACVSSVTEKLISLDEVKDIKIDLAGGNVAMQVSKSLTLEKLSVVLLPKYIPSLEAQPFDLAPLEQTPHKLKQLFPLFLIFVYLI